MQVTPQLLPLEINSEERRQIVLENTIRMLTNRKLLKESNLKENIKKIISFEPDDGIYKIQIDDPYIYYTNTNDTQYIYVKYLMQKITSMSKTSNIGNFLLQYKSNPKIIIVTGITSSANENIVNEYPYSEIFLDSDLMIDKVKHVSVPKHELISQDQKEFQDFFKEYLINKKQMPKIFVTDPIAKYYNAKVGMIFKITRISETSGYATYYRLIIKGSVFTTN